MPTEKKANVITPEFRVSYPSVFQPSSMDEKSEKKYGITMLIPKNVDIKPLRDLMMAAVIEKWPDAAKRPKGLRSPIRDGEEKSDKEGYAGHWFIAARNSTKPSVVDQNVQPILDQSLFYAGCYARASITAFAYDRNGNRGVAFSLQHVQKIRDGEPFSGRTRAEDDFGPVSGNDKGTGVTVAAEADFI
jgi:hypothetical protein